MNLAVTGNQGHIIIIEVVNVHDFDYDLILTAGLAPSVKNISFGSAGNPSRASIPAAIVSRNPLIP